MFINELEGCFGKLGDSEKQWVSENLERLDDASKMNIMHELREHRGTISIPVMQKVLEKVTGKKARVYFWAVCLECGTEYAYGLPLCPACYKKGFECRAHAVKKSEFQPPMSVIKFNKEYIGDGKEVNCYDCPYKEMSYCQHFGQEDWVCRDYSQCQCASCCVKAKKENEAMKTTKQEVHYAVRRAV